ncbi:MAG: tyrosine-type recombinase/integrase, partial [Rhodobacteraceae bacterium]|nr:tyrosine-type recombinase/integrase [Paracoccaceae bacterium]
EVVDCLAAAEAKGDKGLADRSRVGMRTGARIKALCLLRVEDVDQEKWSMRVRKDKSPAGRRTIPIHSKLQDTVSRLVEETRDGYLLPGLTLNKYDDRSNAIGKRFGRLKTDLGFGPDHVYHSIRKTVTTLLENAGVPENVAADIVGHDKPTMTYGTYSGGASLEVMREALEKVAYPHVMKRKETV